MIKSLSYVGFSSPNAADWQTFGPDLLGLALASGPDDDVVRLRMDEATWRIAIHPGDANRLEYAGWETGSEAELADAAEKLSAAGVTVNEGDAELASARSVTGLVWFEDPFGFRHELSYGQLQGDTAFLPTQDVSGFVTGENGLGHLVLMVPDLDQATDFFVGLLGFRHSDDIEAGLKVRFLHCNPRHHTLAMSAVPGHRGVHHLMIEVNSVDDVGHAYDRVVDAGVPLAMTLGRHPNDLMTSFYVRTPSGFEIEYGTGGRLMDMEKEEATGQYDALSIWGHKPPAEPLPPGILEAV
jgi:extradiol dioxygenase